MSMIPGCVVCDRPVSPYGGDCLCERCSQPCPTCGKDVARCVHPLPAVSDVLGEQVERELRRTIELGDAARAARAVAAAQSRRVSPSRPSGPVRLLSVTIGRAVPPQEILDQRTETAAQQQRELTMVAQQKAEQARKGAELARAEADNAYRAEMQLSPEQYVELKKIEMQRSACANGTCIFGNVTPMINTGK